jgi:CelD/BcsL family acetyltransferase involved in cellulose biosynthesis
MLTETTSDAASLKVSMADEDNQLLALEGAWNELAGDVPFRTWQWAHTWWRHYRDRHSKLFTLLVTDEQGELIGIAPWYLHRSLSEGFVIRFLGSGEVCSDYLTLLCREEHQQAVAQRVADWLVREARYTWHLLDLSGVDAVDAAILRLGKRLAEHGHRLDHQADMNCWRVELGATWKEFLAKVSKSRRERVRTLLRRTIEANRAIVHEVHDLDQLQQAFEVFVDLHQRRRQSKSQSGCFESQQFERFHRDIARQFLESGHLRMQWIELDGRPATVEYGFVGNETVYYYQGGLDPALAQESPGWLSLAVSLKLAIESGYREYDFLRGDEMYKTSWGATARPLVRVRVVGRRRWSNLRYSARLGCQTIRSWAKRMFSKNGAATAAIDRSA